MADGTSSAMLDALLDKFKHQYPRYYPAFNNLCETSPRLRAQLEKNLQMGTLTDIQVDETNTKLINQGASYDPKNKMIDMDPNDLKRDWPKELIRLAFVLGHELKHAEHVELDKAARLDLLKDVTEISTQSGIRDYTPAVKKYLQFRKFDESSAEIAGFNTAMDYITHMSPKVNSAFIAQGLLSDYSGAGEMFFDPQSRLLHPDIELDTDGYLAETPNNLEAMGKRYYERDAREARLGPAQTDYQNFYAGMAFRLIALKEHAQEQKNGHPMRSDPYINMKSLGLHQDAIQTTGLNFGTEIKRLRVVDTSNPDNLTTLLFYHGTSIPKGEPSLIKGVINPVSDSITPSIQLMMQTQQPKQSLAPSVSLLPENQSHDVGAQLNPQAILKSILDTVPAAPLDVAINSQRTLNAR